MVCGTEVKFSSIERKKEEATLLPPYVVLKFSSSFEHKSCNDRYRCTGESAYQITLGKSLLIELFVSSQAFGCQHETDSANLST